MTQKWIGELKQKTGRSLEEWLAHIKKAGPKDEKERRAWLKEKHGLGTNTAWWLAERAEGKGAESGDPDLYLEAAERDVEKMFSGGKAKLRPLYDALLKLGLKTGKEAKAVRVRRSCRSIAITSSRRSNRPLKLASTWASRSAT